jgi:hypothetical protein
VPGVRAGLSILHDDPEITNGFWLRGRGSAGWGKGSGRGTGIVFCWETTTHLWQCSLGDVINKCCSCSCAYSSCQLRSGVEGGSLEW